MEKIKNPITRKVISKILNWPMGGWNDKRGNKNRIKLVYQLDSESKEKVKKELNQMFPDYEVVVEDVVWKNNSRGYCEMTVTTITSWKRD